MDTGAQKTNVYRTVFRVTLILIAGLIAAAFLIGFVSYQYSYHLIEKSYQTFYLNKAQMMVKSAKDLLHGPDKALLAALNQYWLSTISRPKDEYICVVDSNSKLLLHSANPATVGKYAGENPLLGSSSNEKKKLIDLVKAQENYVGKYISTQGEYQIAAFVAVPDKKWVLGVHRSSKALQSEIESGIKPLFLGYLIVCSLLMPLALFIIYRTYNNAALKQIKSERALAESEQKYQSLVDAMPQCLYRTDLQGKFLFANKALLNNLNITLDQCLGKTAYDIYSDSLARQVLAEDVQVIRTGSILDKIEERPAKDGAQKRFIQIVRSPVLNSKGEITGIQGIYWDVTDKKQAEAQLEYTKAQLAVILDAVPSGIIAVDIKGMLTLVNNKAESILEVKAKEVLGKHVSEVIPDTGLLDVLSQQKTEFGKPFKWGRKSLVVSRSPIYEKADLIGAVSVFHDQSELEAVQKQLSELRRLNDEFTSLVDNYHDGVVIADTEKIVKVNPGYGRITGLAPSTLEGKKIGELAADKHVCLAVLQEVYRQVIHHRGSATLRRRLNSGNEIFVTGSPVFDQHGHVIRVVMSVRDVTELKSLEEQIKRLSSAYLASEECREDYLSTLGGVVAESPGMKAVIDLSIRVARVDSIVLLSGESGVGKDVLARLIHNLSNRHDKPFVSINCGAIPEHLLESELFGYEKGAFSGASHQGKPGLFEQADGGSVFLDEVGELPFNLQVKLLKVIQEQKFRRLGSVKTVDLDIRIIAATNRNLKEMVKEGRFREDLFYRLFVVPIEIPPLRKRREDIMPLALQFLKHYNKKYDVTRTLGLPLLQVLESYDWPGNVREVQNVIERMVVTADKDLLEPHHLPKAIYPKPKVAQADDWLGQTMNLKEAKETLERHLIEQALAQAGNVREAAKLLGVNHSTVVRKIQKLAISSVINNQTKH